MANEFFQPGSTPGNNAPGSSAIIRGQFEAVAAAFDKMPVMAGNANEIVVINASGTALTSAGVAFTDFATSAALAAVSAQVALKADASNAVLTGAPTASTPPTSDNSPRIATTQFVNDVVTALGGAVPSGDTPVVNGVATPGVSLQVSRSDHVHPTDASRAPAAAATAVGTSFTPTGGLAATNVQAALAELDSEKIGLNSPAFTGNPTAPTPATSDNDTSIATTAFVQALLAQQPRGTSVSSDTPLMNGVASAGIGVDASRYDHIHPSDTTRASLTGVETLTNKTFALGANTVTGTLAQFNAAVTDADLASLAGVETLTNKTFNLTSNILSGTLAQFNSACSNADFASLTGVETLTNKTIALNLNTVSGTLAQFNAACTDYDFASLTGSETLTNKTFTLGANSFSGTLAQFNTACTDYDFVSLTGSETLTNKTMALGSNTVSGTMAQFNTACTNGDFGYLAALQTWSASQRGTQTTDNDLSFDLNVTNNFFCTPTAGATLTFTNLVAGQAGTVILVNGSNYAIAKAASVKVDSSFLTAVSATGTYRLSYYCDGTNVYVTTSQALS